MKINNIALMKIYSTFHNGLIKPEPKIYRFKLLKSLLIIHVDNKLFVHFNRKLN